jgi:hypothetical protein
LRDLSIDETSDLVRIARLATIPTPAFVAHPSIPATAVAAWRTALISFVPPASADPGLSRQPFIAATLQDFDAVEPFAQQARRLLALPLSSPRATQGVRP